MKALTVRQPWAWAIAAGVKTVENRTRRTSYRGPLAIHAGKSFSDRGLISPLLRADWRHYADPWVIEDEWADSLHRGAIIAVAQLINSHTADAGYEHPADDGRPTPCCESPYAEFAVYIDDQRDNTREVVHLVLSDVVALDEPVPCRGMLGFWSLPADVADVVDAQLAAIAGAA